VEWAVRESLGAAGLSRAHVRQLRALGTQPRGAMGGEEALAKPSAPGGLSWQDAEVPGVRRAPISRAGRCRARASLGVARFPCHVARCGIASAVVSRRGTVDRLRCTRLRGDGRLEALRARRSARSWRSSGELGHVSSRHEAAGRGAPLGWAWPAG